MKTRLIRLTIPLLTLGLAFLACKKKPEDAGSPAKSGSASAPATAGEGGSAELMVKWPVGGRFIQRMDLVQNSVTTVPNMPQPVKQSTTMGQDMTLNVLKEVGAGGREVEMRINAVDLSVFQGEREIIGFDSKGESLGDERNPMAGMFRAMVGAKLLFIIDASNKVERVEGWNELVNSMSSAMQGPTRNMLGAMLKEDYFKQMGNFGQGLPGRTTKPGETWPWKTEIAMGPMGAVTVDLIYTFRGWDERNNRKLALIESVGTINAKGEPGGGPMGASINIDNGKWSGQSWFDPERFQVVETVVDQHMNVRMSMPPRPGPGGPAPAGGMTITNVMTQKITFKVAPEGA